jgi:hypothetical protein
MSPNGVPTNEGGVQALCLWGVARVLCALEPRSLGCYDMSLDYGKKRQ